VIDDHMHRTIDERALIERHNAAARRVTG